jgi:DNA polymerase-3 subunit alpha
MAARVVKCGLPGAAITEHGSVSGAPAYQRAMADACGVCGRPKSSHADGGKGRCLIAGEACPAYEPSKKKLILGNEFYVCRKDATVKDKDDRGLSHLVILAKNRAGWQSLLKATSASNHPDHFYYKPRLDLERLGGFAGGNLIALTGHIGSTLADFVFADPKAAYKAATYERAKSYVKDWSALKVDLVREIGRYHDLFGKENVGLEVQLYDVDDEGRLNSPAAQVLANIMRWAGKETGTRVVATPDAHMARPEDAPDQRVLLCNAFKTTLAKVQQQADNGEDVTLGGFFRSSQFHIPSVEHMAARHEPGELEASLHFADMCESYSLSGPPELPGFPTPGGEAEGEHLRALCKEGWERKVAGVVPAHEQDRYRAQLEHEYAVYDKANLHGYFLIAADVCRYAISIGARAVEGRGSAAGTIVGYLLDIHDTDPIKADLSFERFYDDSRNQPGKPAMLPDIDMDFPVGRREAVIRYVRKKYGSDRVAHIATFQSLHGASALTAVFSAHGWGDYKERKEITKRLPGKDQIADKLQEMREETGEASIIKYVLTHHPEDFQEFVKLTPDGAFEGPLGPLFAQASRLEGCKRGRGTHASGIVISARPLAEMCPLVWDAKAGELIAGMDYPELEQLGVPKLDFLGVAVEDKLVGCLETIRTHRVPDYRWMKGLEETQEDEDD